jgi:hypothetical protein
MQQRKIERYAILAFLAILALIVSGCEQKSINQIRAEPNRYANHEVAVVGIVARSFSLLGKGAYEVDDGTGKLWIVSHSGVPREGARVVVKGKIQDGYNLSSLVKLPEPISSGLVMIESSHRAKY